MTTILPEEVIYQILSYLDPRSLAATLQCSTTFYRIATTPAFWELPYLLRWTTGDSEREDKRGTIGWRRQMKLRRLTQYARRAAAEKGLPSASSLESPFRDLQLEEAQAGPSTALELDFYRLFLERIRIDEEVLETLYEQVEATHGRIPAITSLARRFGNDAKDVLTAVVEAQSSCPSWTRDGLPGKSNESEARVLGKGKGKDPLAYDSNSYRINAYQTHLPTTLRSETHHLVILHHAREMLEHLQRREAMSKLSHLSHSEDEILSSGPPIPLSPSLPRQTDTAVSLLTMFRGGESTYVSSQLDIFAAACDLYLQTRFPPSSPSDDPPSLERAKEKAMAICDFLADHGFRGARDDLFSDLDNHFLHTCFTTNRETLPLSLTLIFCGLANRLGLVASLCNFPMRILAYISADPHLPSGEETLEDVAQAFWLDVTAYTLAASEAHSPTPDDPFARRDSWVRERPPVLDRQDLVDWVGRMGVPPNDDFWRPARPGDMVQRAARNVLGSVQRAQIAPRQAQMGQLGQARSAIRQLEVNRRAARLEVQWRELVRVDHAFLSALHGRTDAVSHQAIADRVATALEGHSGVEEDETVWGIVRTWRRESMRALTSAPETWTRPAASPATHFRHWMAQRAEDNDWTLTQAHLQRRADHWSEHEQQAAKYAAVNAFLRLSTHVNAREVDWIAGFLQSYFMLDVECVERDFLGIDPEGGDEDEGEGEGSDSSGEASFSAREVRDGTETRPGVGGIVTNTSARMVLGRMLRAVRMKDAEVPRVNRRPNGAHAEPQVGYRVGTVFRHRTYRYVGSVLGWDPYCAAPEDWIVNMGVDRLPAPAAARRGGRHQPFYHSQVADGTRRYVAEVNVEPLPGPIWIYGTPPEEEREVEEEVVEEGRVLGGAVHRMLELRGLGEYFRCFDQRTGRLRRGRDARVMFPDDVSDNEEVVEERRTDQEEDAVETLSEDGSW